MRKTHKAFAEVVTFADLKKEISNNMDYLTNSFFNNESLGLAFKGMSDMDESTQDKVIKFAHHIDRSMSIAGTAKGNRFHKLPTLMAGCLYLRYYPDQVADLTMEELSLLSKFSVVEKPDFYENSKNYLGQRLLTTVTKKHFDYMLQNSLLRYAENLIAQVQDKEKVAEYIHETDIQELKEKSFEYECQMLDELGKYL